MHTIIRHKTRTVTRIQYRNGYQYISQDPAWNCAGNLWHSYLACAQQGQCGDPGTWAADCPGVPAPAN